MSFPAVTFCIRKKKLPVISVQTSFLVHITGNQITNTWFMIWGYMIGGRKLLNPTINIMALINPVPSSSTVLMNLFGSKC